MEDLRYPIGRYTPPDPISDADVAQWISEIADLPARLRAAVEEMTESQLDTPYRPDGWTVRQVVHHLGDSHLNALARFKWALTEDAPTIMSYKQDQWVQLPDAKLTPVATLDLLDALHARWVALLGALTPEDLSRVYVHPDSGPTPLRRVVGMYAWHGRHHLTHITALAERMGWSSE